MLSPPMSCFVPDESPLGAPNPGSGADIWAYKVAAWGPEFPGQPHGPSVFSEPKRPYLANLGQESVGFAYSNISR